MSLKDHHLNSSFSVQDFTPSSNSPNPGISTGDVAKKLGGMWNNLSDSEKHPYITKAARLKKCQKDVPHSKSKESLMAQRGLPRLSRKRWKRRRK